MYDGCNINYRRSLESPVTDTIEETVEGVPEPVPEPDYHEMTRILTAEIREYGHATTGWFVGRDVFLLTTTGAKSGEPRTIPLAYSRDGETYVVTASKGGAPTHPAWYFNLLADPTATIKSTWRPSRSAPAWPRAPNASDCGTSTSRSTPASANTPRRRTGSSRSSSWSGSGGLDKLVKIGA